MIQRVKGTRDIVPPESRLWSAVEAEAVRTFSEFGYDELRLPVMEPTELFVRGVGEGTDIVSKEMYTFPDRKGRSMTLRPEGTAGVARAFIENGFAQRPQPVRLLYMGPMFRYEKMQRGRYRQFAQIGLEILGAEGPNADVEILLALHTYLERLGFDDLVILLNNLGDPEDRSRFITRLKSDLERYQDQLCGDCRRRWTENPLRILDCKVERCAELVARTTPVGEMVSDAARRHVDVVSARLDALGVPVRWAPRLVRGLDYYLRTVFEVVSPALGEHAVICGGGRYDRLISDLGGPAVPGVGFAIGEDRLVEVLPARFRDRVLSQRPVAVIPVGSETMVVAHRVAQQARRGGLRVELEVTGRSLKAGLKWAGKIDAAAALIVGSAELERGVVIVRDLDTREQREVPLDGVAEALAGLPATPPTPAGGASG